MHQSRPAKPNHPISMPSNPVKEAQHKNKGKREEEKKSSDNQFIIHVTKSG
jgi:hypothetical protein